MVWIAAMLLVGGFVLAALYRDAALKSLDQDLDVVAETVLAGLAADAGGAVSVTSQPNDPRFARALSGRYWAVVGAVGDPAADVLAQSRSVWDASLPLSRDARSAVLATPGQAVSDQGLGPNDEPVRLRAIAVRLPDRDTAVIVIAAADITPALEAARRFNTLLTIALAVLGCGLAVAVALQVRVGLAPLRRMEADVAAIRRGQRARLEGVYPLEVAALAQELNQLLDHSRDVVERARAHVGNLAHALKTPISVLMNEAPPSETGFPAVVRRQAEAMRRAVEHYLTRAAAAARAEALGASTPAVSVLNDLARTLGRLYASEGVQVRVEDCVAAEFRGERQDLEEMIGNLLENACKYGGGLVEARILRAPGEDPQLEVVVEDDGPGISAEQRPAALKRGLRLDETESGSGLGLAIVDDLARAYGGMLVLDESALGGLKAVLRLPAVA